MNATPAHRPPVPSAETILRELSTRQFVRPHRPLGEALADVGERLGLGKAIGTDAAARLDLDLATAVGRLRRTQLAQLAHRIQRLECQAAAGRPAGADAAGADVAGTDPAGLGAARVDLLPDAADDCSCVGNGLS